MGVRRHCESFTESRIRWMVGGLWCVLAWTAASPVAALTLNEAQKLLADDGGPSDRFGYSVALSDNRAVIGAVGERAAYIFTREGGGWSQEAKLVPTAPPEEDFFGFSVGLSGSTVVVGAPLDDDGGFDAGAAYIFARDSAGAWSPQGKLLAGDGTALDYFGDAVALSGDTAVIGAWAAESDGGTGAAYVFTRRSDGIWTEQTNLLPSGGADTYGDGVALSGDTAVIGARGSNAAYVFTRGGDGGWTEQARLTPDDATDNQFGLGVAVSGDTALVGAFADDDKGPYAGAAYVFVRHSGGTWTQQAKLVASDGVAYDYFGLGVALSGDMAVVGAYLNDDLGEAAGSAYLFTRDTDGTWAERAKLLAGDGAGGDGYGFSVAVAGYTALIGASGNGDNGERSGSAYIVGLALTPEQKLDELITDVQTLVESGRAPRGLLAPLEAADISLAQGHSRPAVNQVEAFIRQVEAMMRSGRLSEEEGAQLIDAANGLIETIRSGDG